MAITPEVMDEFLDREFRDSNRWKGASTEQIKKYVFSKLPIRPRFVHEPYHHQWVCLGLGFIYNRFYFALDMGTGKSKIVLDLFRFRVRLKHATRMLVCVPNATNLGQWREQLQEHAPELSFETLTGSKDAKRRKWEGSAQVVVATYAGVRAMVCGKVVGKKGLHPLPVELRKAAQLFDFIVPDEASVLGKAHTLTFRVFRKLAKGASFFYPMSGTLFSGDPQALWAQFYLIDQGWLLGSTLSLFRGVLFRENTTPWGTEWTLRKKHRDTLNRMLRHSSVRFTEKECLDLPDRVGGIESPMIISVDFATAQWKVYDSIEEDARVTLEVDGEVTPEAYLHKRYACAGLRRDSLMGVLPIDGPNPKLDALVELIQDIEEQHGKDEKVVVVHHYQEVGQLIEKRLAEQGIGCAAVRGGKNTDDELSTFKTKKACRVLVASKAAAYGLNLQHARFMLFYEPPDSLAVRKQIERRVYRIGQERVVYYYDFVIRNSVDEKILKSVQKDKRVWQAVVEGDNVL